MNQFYYKYEADSPQEEQEMTEENQEKCTGKLGRTILWASLGLAVVMGAIIAGLELRARRFRRTPYDSYSHAGDNLNSSAEYGVGI